MYLEIFTYYYYTVLLYLVHTFCNHQSQRQLKSGISLFVDLAAIHFFDLVRPKNSLNLASIAPRYNEGVTDRTVLCNRDINSFFFDAFFLVLLSPSPCALLLFRFFRSFSRSSSSKNSSSSSSSSNSNSSDSSLSERGSCRSIIIFAFFGSLIKGMSSKLSF